MNKILYFTIFVIAISISSCCNSHQEEEKTVVHESVELDTAIVDTLLLDTGQYVDESIDSSIIEAKYGVQWDFCDCVVKNDSINKVVENAPEDADYDAIFDRMDEIDQHCKGMLTTPNTTPEEREKHERKVRKCLKNAK